MRSLAKAFAARVVGGKVAKRSWYSLYYME
ncbi:hypothetical protein SAMN05216298_3013 [Glycomyces sambucus]|uniref:Uncharacterized protein n=1 Tax=Glycomyces sambucus TaxID=380244 RepID=A0A1G9I453_9ACTN|nr:hypothetical protein SAMN05216298_3013 [Glycomyces sambucus]